MMLAFILNSIHSTDVGSDRLQAALFMSLYPPLIIILPTLSYSDYDNDCNHSSLSALSLCIVASPGSC